MTNGNMPENDNFLNLSENADKKLSKLLNEIKELVDNDDSNDELEKTFNKSKTELSKWLSKALEKSEVSDIDVLLSAIETVLANQDLDDNGKNSLLSLQWKLKELKESKERDMESAFDKFEGFVKCGDVKGLNKLKDKEIKLVIDFVSNEGNWSQIFNLYKSMDSSKDTRAKSKNFNKVFNYIKDNYQPKIDVEFWKEDLNKVFEGKCTAEDLNWLVVKYLWVNDWNWYNQFDDDDKFSNCGMRFSKADFLRKFNEMNELRMDNNIDKIENFNIDVGEQLSWFKLSEWKLIYNWNTFNNEMMMDLFWESVENLLGELDFVEWEKEFLLNDIFSRVSDIIKEHISQNEKWEQQIEWEFVPLEAEFYDMDEKDYEAMNEKLGNDMFIKKVDNGDVTYNLKKAESYLKWIDRDRKWNEFLKLKWTYEWRAMISAIQILLNEKPLGDKLVIDWKWWEKTIKRIKDFQNNYNDDRPEWSLPLDPDGVPWKRTLTALLEGRYGNTIVEWIWVISGDKFDTFVFSNEYATEKQDNNGRKYIEVDWKKYYEYRKGMSWLWYEYGITDNWNAYIYVWNFDKGNRNKQWTKTYANWNKYIGQFKNNYMDWEWTFTWPDWNKYIGQFKDDDMDWEWTFSFHSESGDKVYNVAAEKDVLKITGPEGDADIGKYIDWRNREITDNPPNS